MRDIREMKFTIEPYRLTRGSNGKQWIDCDTPIPLSDTPETNTVFNDYVELAKFINGNTRFKCRVVESVDNGVHNTPIINSNTEDKIQIFPYRGTTGNYVGGVVYTHIYNGKWECRHCIYVMREISLTS